MTYLRRVLIPVVTTMIATLVAVGVVGRISSASPATTFSLTVAGPDAHTLDPHLQPMFEEGGYVKLVEDDGQDPITYKYLEASLDLPVGAKVTSISASGRACMGPNPVVFGSYQPTTGNTLQTATLNIPDGCVLKTVKKTGSPITTIVAGRRYAIDFTVYVIGIYPGDKGQDAFAGATVKYTCTSPCVP